MIQTTFPDIYDDDLNQDFDGFLGIGKKAKARKKERKARKKNKRALRSKRNSLKVERRQLKNDQRRANTESIRSSNKLNETMVSTAIPNQVVESKSPFNNTNGISGSDHQSQTQSSADLNPPKDYTMEMLAAGLVVLLIAGAIIYKNKIKQR